MKNSEMNKQKGIKKKNADGKQKTKKMRNIRRMQRNGSVNRRHKITDTRAKKDARTYLYRAGTIMR